MNTRIEFRKHGLLLVTQRGQADYRTYIANRHPARDMSLEAIIKEHEARIKEQRP